MENKSVYVLVYSSTNEETNTPYVECLGVYSTEEAALEELNHQYDTIIEDEFDDVNDCDIQKSCNHFSISDKWYTKSFVCSVEERKIGGI